MSKSYEVQLTIYKKLNVSKVIVTTESKEDAEHSAILSAICEYRYYERDGSSYFCDVNEIKELDCDCEEKINWEQKLNWRNDYV